MDSAPPTQPSPASNSDASDLLLTLVATRDIPCPSCGYNLRALTMTRCPECSEALKLQVGLVEPKLAWFITGVVGLAMGSGFGLLVFGAVFIQRILRKGGPNMRDGWPILATGVFCGALTWLWVVVRPRLNPRPPELRWTLALLTYVVSIGLAILCVVYVR